MTVGGVDGSLDAVDDTRGIFAMNLASPRLLNGGPGDRDEPNPNECYPTRTTCSTHINFQLIVSAKTSFLSYPIVLYQLY